MKDVQWEPCAPLESGQLDPQDEMERRLLDDAKRRSLKSIALRVLGLGRALLDIKDIFEFFAS
jgi:hypothetical protein